MNHHRSATVNYNKDSALNLQLAMHQDKSDIKFNKYDMESFTLTPIEQVLMLNTKEDSKKLRLERETFWIDTLDTLEPQGLNRKRYIILYHRSEA